MSPKSSEQCHARERQQKETDGARKKIDLPKHNGGGGASDFGFIRIHERSPDGTILPYFLVACSGAVFSRVARRSLLDTARCLRPLKVSQDISSPYYPISVKRVRRVPSPSPVCGYTRSMLLPTAKSQIRRSREKCRTPKVAARFRDQLQLHR